MKRFQILFICLFSWLPLSIAGEVNPYHIAADSNWYYHYNFEAARNSELALEFRSEIDALFSRVSELDLIDLNPSEDLFSLTLYGNHLQRKGVAILEGEFSPSLYYAIREAKIQKKFVNGYQVYQLKKHLVTIYEEKYIIASRSEEHLASALNVINGTEPHIEIENKLLDSGSILSLAITDIDLAKKQIKKMGKSMMLNLPIQKFSYHVKDDGDRFSSALKILSQEDVTEHLSKLAKGYLGLFEVYLKNLPKLQEFIDSIVVTTDKDLLTVSTDVENDVIRPHIIKFFEKAKEYQQKKAEK